MNYYQEDHAHCWEQENSPCGQKIKHFKCCLCEMNHPEITEAYQAGIDEAVKSCGKIISEIEISLKNSSGSKSEIDGIIWKAYKALQDNK